MSKAKWFVVRKPSTGGIIANKTVLPKIGGGTKMLYYTHQSPYAATLAVLGTG